jgi:S-formylglutathione hydrolase FrmB
MKARRPSSHTCYHLKRRSSFIALGIAFLLAFLSGVFLFSNAISGELTTIIINTGLDPLRTQLLVALVLKDGAAFIGATVGQHKGGALLGAQTIFCCGYLAGFIQLAVQPVSNPGGRLEPLNQGVLIQTILSMLALAFLSAFVGASVGAAFRDVVLDPPIQLVRFLWRRFMWDHEDTTISTSETRIPVSRTKTGIHVISSWCYAGLMIVCVMLASRSADLFLFSPDVGLHTPPNAPHGNGIPAHGTMVRESMVSPALGGQSRSFLVYLPPSYMLPQTATRRYPTLYLLHGTPGHMSDWITGGKADESADLLIDMRQIPELILILPDGNGQPGATSEWGDSFDHRQRIEMYVAVDLVAYVDHHYRTLADAAHRAIGGLSMGGFGAMNIAVHHSDVFRTVISLGGYYRAEGSIWGKNAAYRRANSPIEVLPRDPRAWKLHIYLGAATEDHPYYENTQEFTWVLDALHLPYRFDLQPGYHAWHVWQVQLYHALAWIQWR